jgi:hypothetical protein
MPFRYGLVWFGFMVFNATFNNIESFTPCLIDLCKALWEVMKSYFKTMQWHEKNDINIAWSKTFLC